MKRSIAKRWRALALSSMIANLSILTMPAASHAQNPECASNGGDAECVDPLIEKDWWCVGTFVIADGSPCGNGSNGIICRTESEAVEHAIDNYMEMLPQCQRPKYGPLCPKPWDAEDLSYAFGKLVGTSRAYVATTYHLQGDVCTEHVGETCGNPNAPNGFYGSIANCQRTAECPPGYFSPSPSLPCKGENIEVCPRGNPFDCVTGQKVQREVDIAAQSDDALEFTRYYSSSGFYAPVGADAEYEPGTEPRNLGVHWRHTYQRRVYREPASSTAPPMVTVARPDGDYRHFKLQAGLWVGRPDKSETLTELFDTNQSVGWRYVSADNVVEEFDNDGRLLHVTRPTGFTLELTYSTAATPISIAPYAGLLISVASSDGRSLSFVYDSIGSLIEVSDAAGFAHTYEYDSDGTLQFVTRPSGAVREYLYNEPTHNSNYSTGRLLTGIIDENGHRYGTYQYSYNKLTKEWHGSAFADQLELTDISPTWVSTRYSRMTGALGNFEQVEYAAVNGIVKETARKRCATETCGTVLGQTSLTYDSSGNVDTRTDDNGVLAEYDYDVRGRETSRIEAANASGGNASTKRTVQTEWHASLNVPLERRTLNASSVLEAKTQWAYNTRGQATARCEIDPGDAAAMAYTCSATTAPPVGANVQRWITNYCEQADLTALACPRIGLVKSTNGPRSSGDPGMGGLDDITTYTYYMVDDASCASGGACPHRRGDLWKVTNGLGQVIEYVTYDKAGRVLRTKDANGTITDFVYHIRGWLKERIVRAKADGTPLPAADASLYIQYDAVGNVIKVVQPDAAYLEYAYDDAHRLIEITDNLGNTIDYCPGGPGSADCLDAAGNRRIEQIKDPSNNVKRQLRRTYNQLSQLTQVLNATSQVVETSAGLNATGIADGYDRNGNRVLSDDGLGTRTQQDYDPLNRLKATIQDVGGTDPSTADATTQYVYDTRDNLRQVTDPDGLSTVYDYDGLNRLTGLHSPDTGDTTYSYDAAGNRLSQTDARGVVSSYTYDPLNRLTAVAYPDADLDIAYVYDQAHRANGCSTSFPVGRLTTMVDLWGETRYCYDRRGNVTKKIYHEKGKTAQVTQYSYTLADRLTSITYPSGAVVTYSRNALGQVQGVSWTPTVLTPPTTIVGNTTYAPFGPLTSITYGNGRTQTRAYDQDYAVDAISGTSAGALTLDFEVDVMGNIVEASDSLSPVTPDRVYTYDPMYRLTKAETGATPPSSLESYTYNPTGDRLSASLNGNPADTYAYVPNTHRLASVGATARTYDNNGNTLTGLPSGYTLTYDDRNRLRQATKPPTNTATYRYNGKGERMGKAVSNGLFATVTAFAYDEGGRLLGEYDEAGNVLAEYVYLDDMPIAVIKDATPYYLETDHLGTPRQVIDPVTDIVLWKWDLLDSVFGANNPNEDADGDNATFRLDLRFPGQYGDAETGLHYNLNRDYDYSTGRYVESDAIGLVGGNATFAYANNSPLIHSDRFGFAPSPPTCNGPDCVNPPYDPTPNGPAPSPQPTPDKKEPNSCPEITKKTFGGCGCADTSPNLATCIACCGTVTGRKRSQGGTEGGSICAETCYRKAGITLIVPNPNHGMCLASSN